MAHDYQRSLQADEASEEEAFAELEVADYLVFLLAYDTYVRWLKETGQRADHVFGRGLMLLKMAERDHLDKVNTVIAAGLKNPGTLKMLAAAMRLPSNASGASKRALKLRTVISRGGTATAKHIFGTSIRARKAVTDAIQAATTDQAPEALTMFAGITLKNKRLEKWIASAADTAGKPIVAVNPAHEATKQVAEDGDALRDQKITQEAARPDSEQHAEAQVAQANTLARVENHATEAAAKALATIKAPDEPVTRSQATGIATAVATAVANDPQDLKNIPPAFINKGLPLDPEQMDAALTNGRVLVAAGAGAGKSTTLVSRVAYLVDNQGTNPSRIMAVTFNKKAALELQEKLGKKLGAERAKAVMCDTMHTVFKKLIIGDPRSGIPGFGSPQEQRMMGPDLIATPRKGFPPPRVKPGDVSRTINTMWNQCEPEDLAKYTGWPTSVFENGPPKTKKAGLYINKWAGNDIGLQEAKTGARSDKERLAALYYEFYLGLKGDIPGWRPPCGQAGFSAFMGKFRKGNERLGDMDDMLKIFRDILRRDPKARTAIQGMYDHILIDEAQDSNTVQHQIFDSLSEHIECDDKKKSIWLVGDDRQCVASGTLVSTPGGTHPAGGLEPGMQVLSYRNGELAQQTVRHVVPSSWTWGYRIATDSGKTLLMSPNHKIWATSPEMGGDRTIVYLMYRKDMGFRVGITNKCESPENPYGNRAHLERADRLWLLDVCETREEALFQEESYSLKYGIPTMVFEGADRGLNQDRIARVFAEFGKNGAKLLEERYMSFDLPNWQTYSYTKFGTTRRTIQLIMHAAKGSQVALEWMGDDLQNVLDGVRYENLEGGRHRLRRFFSNYREALVFAETLKEKTGASLRKRLSTPEGPLSMLTASALVPSMSVAVRNGDTVVHEQIVSVEKEDGTFVDLDVDDASNFFGGDILSSNSIYQFRGAKPELFQKHWNDGCWKPKMIRTNYRCPPEVVDVANRLISHNEERLPVDAIASKYKTRGEASVKLETQGDNTAAAIDTLDGIRKDLDTDPKNRPEDYAVLARTNAELNNFETACIINEIPYMRRGGHGFLDAPESKVLLGYIDLAAGTDFEKMQRSLVSAITKPDRGLYLSAAQVETAVKEAIDDVARYERKDVKDIDPNILLTDRTYARKFAEYLKGPYKNVFMAKGAWLWNKKVDGLTSQILDMGRDVHEIRKMTADPDMTTGKLLGDILDKVASTTVNWDPVQRREVSETQSLREDITNSLKLYSADDDDDDETTEEDEAKPEFDAEGRPIVQDVPELENPAKGLGAIQFLYALSEPNKNDHELGILPDTAAGFAKKIERYSKLADGLRIEPRKWEEAQKKITDPALRQERPPAVNLTTVHAVKGLEWPHVTVLMPKGLFPIELRVKPGEQPPSPEEAKEHDISERNLAYVAITRAAKTLKVISIPDPKTGENSPYIDQAGLNPGENVPKPESTQPEPVVTAGEDFTVGEAPEALDAEAVYEISMWPDNTTSYDRRPQ